MATHEFRNTPEEREDFLELARGVAAEFDVRGREADANNQFPMDTKPIFKASGLHKLQVPKELGGLGADVLSVALVQAELAKGDPAIALAYNMHQVMVGIMKSLMTPDSRDALYRQIAEDDVLVCGAFSEERAGITGLSDTIATKLPDGSYKVNGRKTWCSLAEAGDVMTFNAAIVDESGLSDDLAQRSNSEGVFAVAKNHPGITIKYTWDTMGMRATGTQSILFEDAIIPAECFGGNFRQGFFGHFEWVSIPFAGTYLGLAQKAYEVARDELRTKSLGTTAEGADVKLAHSAFIQHQVGKMCLDVQNAERTLEATCEILLSGRDQAWHPMARTAFLDVAKVTTTETAKRITDDGMRLIGGNTFRRGQVLERLYRDSRAGPFHPLTTDQAHDLLGKAELGLLPSVEELQAQAAAAAGAAAETTAVPA